MDFPLPGPRIDEWDFVYCTPNLYKNTKRYSAFLKRAESNVFFLSNEVKFFFGLSSQETIFSDKISTHDTQKLLFFRYDYGDIDYGCKVSRMRKIYLVTQTSVVRLTVTILVYFPFVRTNN